MFHDTWMRRLSWVGSILLVLISGAALRAQERLEAFVNEGAGDVAAEAAQGYWLGLVCHPADAALRGHLKLKDTGLIVHEVVPDTPAAKAGVKVHDVLVAAGEQTLSKVEQLVDVANKSEGKELTLTVIRDGEKTAVKITPVKRPDRAAYGKMPDDVRGWLERRAAGTEPWRWQGVGPGVVTKSTFFAPQKLPKDMSVTITKEGENPAKITVKQGEKAWEVAEDKLDDLPAEVRKHVAPMVRPGAMFLREPAFDGWKADVVKPRVWELPGAEGQKRLEKRVEDLNKQIEQLRKSIEEMSKNKAK
jgi:membrane-associated protease RseP (regulator of RpoE activity)